MSRRTALLCVLLSHIFVPIAAAQTLSERALAQAIDRILDQEDFDNALWGVQVVDLADGETLYERNGRKSFVPASNVKLYTTAAALEQLGTGFSYTTTLWSDGIVEDGTLKGNLIVRGSGDPSIGGRFHDGDRLFVFRAWADSLRAHGVTRIAGDIIGDDDLFDDVPLGSGWSWDDETYWYAAEISALSFNDNNIDFEIRARAPGEPASIVWEPLQTSYVDVLNQTETVHRDSALVEGYRRPRASNEIHLSSRVPEGRVDFESLTVTNPTLFFTHVLRESLIESGIVVDGRPVDVDDISIKPDYDSSGTWPLASYTSVPLTDIVEVINKRSQNLYAEQLLKTLGAHRPVEDARSEVGSAAMGIEAATRTWAPAGVDTSRIRIADGSGLSRRNLVTPEMTTMLLAYMWAHPDADVRRAFIASLPVGGVDGTLQSRFQAGAAHANVQAKTGSLGSVSSLAGYVRMRNGRYAAFTIMANHYTSGTRAARQAQDEIVELLASW